MSKKFRIRVILKANNGIKKLCWLTRDKNSITLGFNLKNEVLPKDFHWTLHPGGYFRCKTEKEGKFQFVFPEKPPIEDIKNILPLITFGTPLDRIEISYENYRGKKYEGMMTINKDDINNKNRDIVTCLSFTHFMK